MAKPKHGRRNISNTSTSTSLDARPHTRPWRSSSRPSPCFPSPGLLSALALIATSPTRVAGGPLPTPTAPPAFLCPFIDRAVPQSIAPRAPTPSSSTTPVLATNHPLVADKFVEGSDRRWRKTDAWTLYGSVCCSSSTPSTSAVPFQPSTSPSSMPTSVFSSVEFDTSVLPAGWDNASNVASNNMESTIILALAIVLAGCICVFMLTCLVWRRRKKKSKDLERKPTRKLGADERSEIDTRGKMRMWARASARWKSHIRQSARRRRKRPVVPSMASRPLSPTLPDSPQVPLIAPSVQSRPPSIMPTEPGSSTPHLAPSDATDPTVYPRSASPPTYGASFVPRFSHLSHSSAVSNPGSTSLSDVVQRSNRPSFAEDEPIPYVPPSDGHVATDDKAQLARIQESASSPPSLVNAASASALHQPVSAPEWHEIEEDLEDLGADLSQVSMSHEFDLPPSFPLPPSKADVPFRHLDSLPLCYGELEPDPPASPSAPPIDDPILEPSAPSLEGEDGVFQDWDEASSYVAETPAPAGLGSGLACSGELVTSSTAPHASYPPIHESAAGDGILPRYHP